MIAFEFAARSIMEPHSHREIELFYVMEGKARFVLEEKQYELNKDDFLVINADKTHSCKAQGSFLAACLLISFSELCRMMKRDRVFFWCNTAVDNNESCDELRGILHKIVSEHYHHGDQDTIYLNSLYYQLLHILTHDFLLNKEDRQYSAETHGFDARRHEIEEYIQRNFDKPISLEDLSQKLFLSYAYLSKYIKRNFGMGFSDYVNAVRLDYAVSQLLHSDQSVARIAVDAGFASSAALNKAFREKYGTTPTEYRRQRTQRGEIAANAAEEQRSIQEQLDLHFRRLPFQEDGDKTVPDVYVSLLHAQKRVLKKNWCRMINVGAAADLLHSDMQSHVLFLKQELNFEYVRFWDLYAPEMYLNLGGQEGEYNFNTLDRVIDFLLKNGLKPYIELRPKPKLVMQNKDKFLIDRDFNAYLDNPENMARFAKHFMIHLLNRYNSDKVETWFFELWASEPEQVWGAARFADRDLTREHYLRLFDATAEAMRAYLPDVKLGGGGFSMRYGEDVFRDTLNEWKGRKQLPDFISVYCYPYNKDALDRERNQSKNVNFLRDNLTEVRRIMEETDFPVRELHVTEWNFSVSNRNVLNDHCMKGAYLVKNMTESIGLADLLGYWVGSDLYAVYYDTRAVLSGSGGLLSKDGIRKPAYFAFDFMNRLGKYVRKIDEHYIITDNGTGNWRIVCNNLKNLSYQYGLRGEDEVRLEDQNDLFSDLKKLRLHFELPGKRDGKYRLRIMSVNQAHGSLQDEWMAMARPKELSAEDLKYLSRITTPRMVLQYCQADNGKIALDVALMPNEIAFIHVTHQYA